MPKLCQWNHYQFSILPSQVIYIVIIFQVQNILVIHPFSNLINLLRPPSVDHWVIHVMEMERASGFVSPMPIIYASKSAQWSFLFIHVIVVMNESINAMFCTHCLVMVFIIDSRVDALSKCQGRRTQNTLQSWYHHSRFQVQRRCDNRSRLSCYCRRLDW